MNLSNTFSIALLLLNFLVGNKEFLANQKDHDVCRYAYIVVWVDEPTSLNGYQSSSNEKFLISNVFETCKLVQSAYSSEYYHLSEELKEEIKKYLKEKYNLREGIYNSNCRLYISSTTSAIVNSSNEVFNTMEDASKARSDFIKFVKNIIPPNYPTILYKKITTNKVETFIY